jgi:HlyD family secretion protein
MKKWIIGLVLLIFLGGGSYALIQQRSADAAEDPQVAAETTEPTVVAGDQVTVEAEVVPRQSVELRFPSSDIVDEVLVKEGDKVEKGTRLARLDMRRLALNVEQAKATLAQAQASYDRLEVGATPEEIAAAEAEVAQAQAQLTQTQGSVTANDLRAAEAQLQSARAALAKLEAGPKTAEVQAARAVLTQAQTRLAETQAGPKTSEVQAARATLDQAKALLSKVESGPKEADVQAAQAQLDQAKAMLQSQSSELSKAKTQAHSQMEQAVNDLRDRQAEYNRIFWENKNLEDRVGTEKVPQEARDQEAAALRAVQNAEQAVLQARVAYEQALQAEVAGVAAAQAQVDQAQANLDKVFTTIDSEAVAAARAQVAQAQAAYDKLVRIDPVQLSEARAQVAQAQANLDKLLRVDPADLAAARAQVAQAQANLNRLQGAERQGSVAAAAAGVDNAQANLDRISAKALDTDLASMLAEVKQAEVAVKAAELALDQATIRAPIAGTVAKLNLKVGEVPSAEEPAIVVADISAWQIETTDLTELNVVKITEGDTVTITFDALPGVEIPGTVRRIESMGENSQGEIVYTAIIDPKTQDQRLRWKMTASVVIDSR